MDWIEITNTTELEKIKEKSKTKPQLIFKHSTRCSISSVAKSRLERGKTPDGIDFYYLDLISHRDISAKVAEIFSVYHESPQILLIKNGECVYDESHAGISLDDITEQAATA